MKTIYHPVIFRPHRLVMTLIAIMCISASLTVEAQTITSLTTNKALYNPGNAVTFNVKTSTSKSGSFLRVRYYHLSVQLSTQDISFTGTNVSWNWSVPSTDHQGYLVKVELRSGSTLHHFSTIGVNVSTNHARFPIYGFLSEFPSKTDYEMDVRMEELNRYHINWIQFYDWMDTHHDPLAGTASSPATQWNDLANRPTYFETVKGYIDRGHNNYNMKSMLYSLVYGVYSNEWFDPSWHLYNSDRSTIWNHPLPGTWETSALNMMDLNNTNWRNYFFGKITEAYTATNLHFDGWHMDQLGDFGYKYTSTGQQVDVALSFPGFIQAAKNAQPGKSLVFNAVNTYGQSVVANSPTDFLYTELWDGNESYSSLGNIIQTNEGYAPGKKNVYAAYVGKQRSGSPGTHSEGAVLLADATIFAFGGAHIELGEHLLCNEYFPNNNLSMSSGLKDQLVSYYDFMVAYENILRDGRNFNGVTLSGTGAQYWPPVQGKIATTGVSWNGNQVFHCLNYSNVTNLNWRNDQPVPSVKTNIQMSFPYTTPITRMWVASPDINKGVPQSITFTQTSGVVSFRLPSIKYWTMVVAETSASPSGRVGDRTIGSEDKSDNGYALEQNSPNPFQTKTVITFSVPARQHVELKLSDMKGNHVSTLVDGEVDAGVHRVEVKGDHISTGLYTYTLRTAEGIRTKKMIKVE